MDTVLLLIFDLNLRQLYHELLLSRNIEVVPANNVANASLFLAVHSFNAVVVYLDDATNNEITVILKLRKKYTQWAKTPCIFLTSDSSNFINLLNKQDTIINPIAVPPTEVANKIKQLLRV